MLHPWNSAHTFFPAPGARAAPPLTAEIKPLAIQSRALAPETLDVKLRWTGGGLLEGALVLSLPDGDESGPQYRSHDLALTTGVKDFRLLIPPSAASAVSSFREMHARFITKTGVIDLGRFDLGARRGPERTFAICVARPRMGGAAAPFTVWQSLRMERFQPDVKSYQQVSASTLPVHTEPEEMPATALGYTPYDIVLLEGSGFTQMREKPLAALARWVLAGGSLCVIASSPIEPGHGRFLDGLLAADPRAFDAGGRLRSRENDVVLFARPGFGRLIVTAAAPHNEDEAKTAVWIRAATFLWKFNDTQTAEVLKSGTWQPGTDQQNRWDRQQQRRTFAELLAP